MTPDLEATLRDALERATAGDWLAGPADMFGDHNIILAESEDRRAVAAVVSNMRPEDEVEANAAFIALAKNHMGDLLDTLTALRAQVEWRPIETAPKDGRRFLVWDSYYGIRIGRWNKRADHDDGLSYMDAFGGSSKGGIRATHWLPLPPAPATLESSHG